MIRVVITGSHSVGKTTLTTHLLEKLSGAGITCAVAEEPIKVVCRTFPDISQNKEALYLRLVEEHFRRLNAYDCSCCLYDRSFLDLLTYYRLEGTGNPHFDGMLCELLKAYVTFIDIFLYIPVEIPLVPDGNRPLSENYRTRVDEMLKTVAGEAAINWIQVDGSMKERVAAAEELIKKKKQWGKQ